MNIFSLTCIFFSDQLFGCPTANFGPLIFIPAHIWFNPNWDPRNCTGNQSHTERHSVMRTSNFPILSWLSILSSHCATPPKNRRTFFTFKTKCSSLFCFYECKEWEQQVLDHTKSITFLKSYVKNFKIWQHLSWNSFDFKEFRIFNVFILPSEMGSWRLKNRLQISFLTLSEFKRINFYLKSSYNLRFSGNFRGNRS